MTGARLKPVHRKSVRWFLGMAGLAIAGTVVVRQFRAPDPDTLVAEAASIGASDPAAAEQFLRTAITLSSGRHQAAEAALCELAARQGRWDDALRLFRDLDLAACSDAMLIDFGRRAYEAGHVANAVTALSEVRGRKSADGLLALDVLFLIERDRGDDAAMLECVRDMALLQNDSPELWWKLIELLDRRNMTTDAIDSLRQALKRPLPTRDLSEMRHQLVIRLVDQGAADEARVELSVLAASEPGSPRVHLHEAAIRRLKGQPGQALEAIQAAFAAGKPGPGMLHLRAMIYLDLKDFRAAADDLRAETLAKPFDLVAHFKLAETYTALGEAELAARHATIAADIRHKRQQINQLREHWGQHQDDRDACVELARLCRELGDRDEAERWEKHAAQPTSPAPHPEQDRHTRRSL